MSEICKAKYRWTHEELKRAMRFHYRLKLRRVLLLMKVFSVALLAFIGIVLIAWLVLPSSSPPPFWALGLLAIFCVYWLMIDRLKAWDSSRGFTKRPDANLEIEWQFSTENIKSRTQLGEATVDWKSFLRVVESREGFLIYPLENFFHWVPFSAFESADCVERVRELVRENSIPLVEARSRKRLQPKPR